MPELIQYPVFSGFRLKDCRNDDFFSSVSPAKAGVQSKNVLIQVLPLRVLAFYQLQFPLSLPFFDRLFTRDSRHHSLMHLIPSQHMDAIFLGKPFYEVVLVFPYSLYKIGCHTDIESPVSLTGKDVNTRLFRHRLLLRHPGEWVQHLSSCRKSLIRHPVFFAHSILCLRKKVMRTLSYINQILYMKECTFHEFSRDTVSLRTDLLHS